MLGASAMRHLRRTSLRFCLGTSLLPCCDAPTPWPTPAEHEAFRAISAFPVLAPRTCKPLFLRFDLRPSPQVTSKFAEGPVQTGPEVWIAVDQPIACVVTCGEDATWTIPAMRVEQTAKAGTPSAGWFEPKATGDFPHTVQAATIKCEATMHVVTQAEFDARPR